MKKKYIYMSVLAMATVFASCQKEDGLVSKSNSIGIAKASVGLHVESRAAGIEVRELPSIKTDEAELSVTETITQMEAVVSRAGETKDSTLKADGFLLDGFVPYRAEGKSLHFMENAQVTYNKENPSDPWQIAGDYQWIDEQEHTFWAHSGTPDNLEIPSPYTTAKFTYNNDGREDLVFAYTTQKYSTSSGTPKQKIEKLNFTHALAGVSFDLRGITFLALNKEGTAYEPIATNRVLISNVSIESYSYGECSVTDNTYTWSKLANMELVSSYAPDCTMGFIIPQSRAVAGAEGANATNTVRKVQVAFLDKATFKTHRFSLDLDFTSGEWAAGNNYKYSLSGTVKLPYASGTVILDNLDLKVSGWTAIPILTDIMYLKRFKITWYGTPIGKGQSSFCGLSIEKTYNEDGTEVDGDKLNDDHKYASGNGSKVEWYWNRTAADWKGAIIGWSWDTNESNGSKLDSDPANPLWYGTYESDKSYENPITKKVYYGYCTANFDVSDLGIDDNTSVTLWVVYYGQNCATTWTLGDVEIEVLEYR